MQRIELSLIDAQLKTGWLRISEVGSLPFLKDNVISRMLTDKLVLCISN